MANKKNPRLQLYTHQALNQKRGRIVVNCTVHSAIINKLFLFLERIIFLVTKKPS